MKELYAGKARAVLMLSDVPGFPECEIEDILGENVLLPFVSDLLGKKITLNKDDRAKANVVEEITSAFDRLGEKLPEGCKPEVARRLAVNWTTVTTKTIPSEVLEGAENLFNVIIERFSEVKIQ